MKEIGSQKGVGGHREEGLGGGVIFLWISSLLSIDFIIMLVFSVLQKKKKKHKDREKAPNRNKGTKVYFK